MKRISVFVDGGNFFYLQKDCLRWWIDPKKMLDWIGQYGEIVDATYYASVDSANEAQEKYIKALCHMGFSVEEKPIKLFTTPDGNERHKSNMDAEIVADMFNRIDTYDVAVLVSGDADFVRALQLLKARGKHFMVLSAKGFVAREIRTVAGMHYKELSEMRELISK